MWPVFLSHFAFLSYFPIFYFRMNNYQKVKQINTSDDFLQAELAYLRFYFVKSSRILSFKFNLDIYCGNF